MNKEKIKEKINSIIEEAFDQKKYFESLNNKEIFHTVNAHLRENIEFNLPKEIKRYSDYDILLCVIK